MSSLLKGRLLRVKADPDRADKKFRAAAQDVPESIRVYVRSFAEDRSAAGNPYRSGLSLGSQRTLLITTSTTRRELADLLTERVKDKLSGDITRWTYSLSIEGRGKGTIGTPTEISLEAPPNKTDDTFYQAWLDSAAASDAAVIQISGPRNTSKTVGDKPGGVDCKFNPADLDNLGKGVKEAMLNIWTRNRCEGRCNKRSSRFPACWIKPGTDEHINLTVASTLYWAIALADGKPGVQADKAPKAHPYYSTTEALATPKPLDAAGPSRLNAAGVKASAAPSLLNAAGPSHLNAAGGTQAQASTSCEVERPKKLVIKQEAPETVEYTFDYSHGGKENEPILLSSDGDVKADDSVSTATFGAAGTIGARTILPSTSASGIGPEMGVLDFCLAYALPDEICAALLNYGVDTTDEISFMEASDFKEAGLTGGQIVKIRAALGKWRKPTSAALSLSPAKRRVTSEPDNGAGPSKLRKING